LFFSGAACLVLQNFASRPRRAAEKQHYLSRMVTIDRPPLTGVRKWWRKQKAL
jgi:hypothetical protein